MMIHDDRDVRVYLEIERDLKTQTTDETIYSEIESE